MVCKTFLKNAARQGAGVAVVTPSISDSSYPDITCSTVSSCPAGDSVINAICCQPGIKKSVTTASVVVDPGSGPAVNGDTITVTASTTFNFVIGDGIWPWAKTMIFTTSASMRYE